MKLTGQQYKQLVETLEGAFPDEEDLEQLLKFHFDKSLEAVAKPGNLHDRIFEVIKSAEAKGWLGDLIKAAKKENPDSPFLQGDIYKDLEQVISNPKEYYGSSYFLHWLRSNTNLVRGGVGVIIILGVLVAIYFWQPKKAYDVLLMDSAYPDYVYNERTRDKRLSNNDDIEEIIDDLGIRTPRTELVSSDWTKSDAIRQSNPDLIILHLSAFAVPRDVQLELNSQEHPRPTDGSEALKDFLSVMADSNSQFVIYSRVIPEEESLQKKLITQLIGVNSNLEDRIHLLPIDAAAANPFDEAANQRQIRNVIRPLIPEHTNK